MQKACTWVRQNEPANPRKIVLEEAEWYPMRKRRFEAGFDA
jgi:hypothetical protein